MHNYIFDQYLSEKKYQTILDKIESRLTDLGINGRIEKLTILKSFSESVSEIVKRGADTIIAVGNDRTISKVISLLPKLNITLGIIPIGPNNEIAKKLGIPEGEAACDILSARLVEKIDLGKANNYYFISNLKLPINKEVFLDYGSYNIRPITDDSQISICNFDLEINNSSSKEKRHHCNPKDGLLEAVFTQAEKPKSFFNVFNNDFSESSIFPFKKVKIKCNKECLPAIIDGHTTIKTPIAVEVLPKKLKIIVGKNRMF
ncbi:MAG: diacylglycerol/lipid kinase family protein [Candidatus Kerfeldbacteria bacterium]